MDTHQIASPEAPIKPADQFAVTGFPDQFAQSKKDQAFTLAELAAVIRATRAPDKASLPWLKLATLGQQRSDKGSYRHNANVETITGLEGDYDGGLITFTAAVDKVRQAGVRALLYTTPSNRDAKPHWRVLCPISTPLAPAERAALMDKLNGLVGGGLARESWTLSQSYYFGSIDGQPAVQVEIIDGDFIDQRDDIAAIPKPGGSASIAGGSWAEDGDTYRRGDTSFTVDGSCIAVTTPGKSWAYYADTDDKIAEARQYMDSQEEQVDQCYAHAAMLHDLGLSPDGSVALLAEYGADEDHARDRVEHLWRYAQNAPGEKTAAAAFGYAEMSPEEQAAFFARYEAASGSADPSPAPRRFIKSRAQMRDEPDAAYLIEGLLPEDCDAELVAPSGYLKSFVATDLAFAVATGRDALGQFKVNKPGPVFYFAAEGARNLKKKRATAWEIANGYDPYSVDDIFIADVVPLIGNKALVNQLIEEAKEWLGERPAALFVNDTLNRSLDGADENDAATAAKYLNMVAYIRRALGGGASLTLHHTGYTETGRGRGSSGFYAGYDVSLLIDEHERSEATHRIALTVKKQKDDEDGQRFYLRSRRVDLPGGGDSLVLDPISAKEGAASSAEKMSEAALRYKIFSVYIQRRAHNLDDGMTTANLVEGLTGRKHEGESDNDFATREKSWYDALQNGAKRPRFKPCLGDLFEDDNRDDGSHRRFGKPVRKWFAPRQVCMDFIASQDAERDATPDEPENEPW